MAQEFLGADYGQGSVVTDVRVIRRVETYGLRIRARALVPQRWDVALELVGAPRLRRDVIAHQASQGLALPFDVPMPQDYRSTGPLPVGRLGIKAAKAAGQDTISVQRVGDIKGEVKAGMFVGIQGATKVYRVVSADNSYAAAADLKIYPALVGAVAGGDVVVLEPLLRVVYSGDLAFGVQPTDEGTADVALLGLQEHLG